MAGGKGDKGKSGAAAVKAGKPRQVLLGWCGIDLAKKTIVRNIKDGVAAGEYEQIKRGGRVTLGKDAKLLIGQTSYNLYMKNELPKVKAANLGIAHTVAFGMVARNWRELPKEVKMAMPPLDIQQRNYALLIPNYHYMKTELPKVKAAQPSLSAAEGLAMVRDSWKRAPKYRKNGIVPVDEQIRQNQAQRKEKKEKAPVVGGGL
ncbi:hypothetical protein HDV00_007974 [Rhizophlyctis rosea]|nr:hypothetical protein HDV00_007974 [Rhizophlyctis rosea]